MHDAADLVVAPDHRIKFAAAGKFSEVFGIALERLILRFGILVGHPLRSTYPGQRLENGAMVGAMRCQQFLRGVALQLGDGEQ